MAGLLIREKSISNVGFYLGYTEQSRFIRVASATLVHLRETRFDSVLMVVFSRTRTRHEGETTSEQVGAEASPGKAMLGCQTYWRYWMAMDAETMLTLAYAWSKHAVIREAFNNLGKYAKGMPSLRRIKQEKQERFNETQLERLAEQYARMVAVLEPDKT